MIVGLGADTASSMYGLASEVLLHSHSVAREAKMKKTLLKSSQCQLEQHISHSGPFSGARLVGTFKP